MADKIPAANLDPAASDWVRWVNDKLSTSVKDIEQTKQAQVNLSKTASGTLNQITVVSEDVQVVDGLVTRTPAAPVLNTPTTNAYWDTLGNPVASISLGWEAVANGTDGEPISVTGYEVWIDSTYALTTDTNFAMIPGLAPGVPRVLTVRSRTASGVMGPFSAPANITTASTFTALGTPSTPVLSSGLGVIVAKWDGKLFGGANVQPQFSYLNAYMSTTQAGTYTLTGQTLSGPGEIVIGSEPLGAVRWIKFELVDKTGQKGPQSVPATVTVTDTAFAAAQADLSTKGKTWTQATAPAAGAFYSWVGTPGSSASTKTDAFGTVTTNYATNPSFEYPGGTPTTVVRTNDALNPNLLTNTTGWSSQWYQTGGGGSTLRTAGAGVNGEYGYKKTWTTAPTSGNSQDTGMIYTQAAAAGDVKTVSMYVASNIAQSVYFIARYRDVGGAVLSTFNTARTVLTPGEHSRFVISMSAAPANTNNVQLYVYVDGPANGGIVWAVGDWLTASGAQIETGSTASPYFSGSSPAAGDYTYGWAGTAGASASYQIGEQIGQVGSANTGLNLAALYRSREWALSGPNSMRITPRSTGFDTGATVHGSTGSLGAFVPGKTYTLTATIRLNQTITGALMNNNRYLCILYTDSVRGWTGSAPKTIQAPNTPGVYKLSMPVTVSAGATWATVRLYHGGSAGSGDVWWDDFSITETPAEVPFFYGDSVDDRANDLWLDTANGNKPMVWDSSTNAWVAAPDAAIATAQTTATNAATAAATADGKAVAADAKAVTADGKAVTAQGTANTAVTNAATADGKAVAAQGAANTALTAANSKNQVTYSLNIPSDTTNPGTRAGDLWFRRGGVSNNEIIGQYEWSGSTWLARTITDALITNLNAATITAGFINAARFAANSIAAGKLEVGVMNGYLITGLNMQTDAGPTTGLKLNNSGFSAYNASGVKTVDISATTGAASFIGDFQSGSGSSIFKATPLGIQLGHATFGSAPFRVTAAGELTALNATIEGEVNATSGSITGTLDMAGGGSLINATINTRTNGAGGGNVRIDEVTGIQVYGLAGGAGDDNRWVRIVDGAIYLNYPDAIDDERGRTVLGGSNLLLQKYIDSTDVMVGEAAYDVNGLFFTANEDINQQVSLNSAGLFSSGPDYIVIHAENDTGDALIELQAPGGVRDSYLPEPVKVVQTVNPANVTATTFSLTTAVPTITLNLPYDCWVDIKLGIWMLALTAGDVRVSVSVSGATTVTPVIGNDTPVLIRHSGDGTGSIFESFSTMYRLNKGSNVIRVGAFQTGGNTKQINFGILEAVPLRAANPL